MEEIEDYFQESVEELKRADHLIFVSLKYTRTCDVIKHIIQRLINSLDFIFMGMLLKLESEKKIKEIPSAAIPKINVLKEFYSENEDIIKFLDLYLRLRLVNKAGFTRAREFRRHVTMTCILADNEVVEMNIDKMTDYYKEIKEFIYSIKEKLLIININK